MQRLGQTGHLHSVWSLECLMRSEHLCWLYFYSRLSYRGFICLGNVNLTPRPVRMRALYSIRLLSPTSINWLKAETSALTTKPIDSSLIEWHLALSLAQCVSVCVCCCVRLFMYFFILSFSLSLFRPSTHKHTHIYIRKTKRYNMWSTSICPNICLPSSRCVCVCVCMCVSLCVWVCVYVYVWVCLANRISREAQYDEN